MLGWLRRRSGVAAAQRLVAKGTELERQGRIPEAREAYQAAVDAAPAHAAARLNLGAALEALGRTDDAERAYQAVRDFEPGNPYAIFNLGRLAYARGQLPRAQELLEEALRQEPDFAEAQVVLASVHESRGNLEDALRCLEVALQLRPGYEGAQRNLGLLHAKLGNLRFDQGRLAEARAHFLRAAALQPTLADAHAGLGNVCLAEQALEDATRCYRRALELDPRLAHAQVNLGNALVSQGELARGLECYDAALALDPENAEARWCRAMSVIPAVRESVQELHRSRAEFAGQLAALDGWFDGSRAARGFRVVGLRQPFWLAYQGERNTELLRGYGRLCARLMQAWPDRPSFAGPAVRTPGPLRVGVVSRHFRQHSVWHALVRGWFEQLDRERFETSGFCLGGDEDEETRFARSNAVRFEQDPRTLEQWVASILAARPDVLIYPEIGMDPMSLKLASLRLARWQAASWGHPETTGLPTIDCYLSAEGLEPEGAQANYTEELVTLPHLGCCVRPEAALPDVRLEALGLDRSTPLLVCAGTPFKYAPEQDRVLVRIARELGACRFVFFTHGMRSLSDRLQRRLAAAFAAEGLDAARHVHVLAWLSRPAFLGLMRHADAYLDTIGFSGFNTALQAVQCGLPVVTLEGRFLRGRLASGILRRIGLPELVAQDADQYAAVAVRVCRDPAYRGSLRERMAQASGLLFGDVAPIRALEDLLLARAG